MNFSFLKDFSFKVRHFQWHTAWQKYFFVNNFILYHLNKFVINNYRTRYFFCLETNTQYQANKKNTNFYKKLEIQYFGMYYIFFPVSKIPEFDKYLDLVPFLSVVRYLSDYTETIYYVLLTFYISNKRGSYNLFL